MSEFVMPPTGLLFSEDVKVLIESIDRVISKFKDSYYMNFVEIGVHEGQTSAALVAYIMDKMQIPSSCYHKKGLPEFTYYGIDIKDFHGKNIPQYVYVKGPSHLVISQIPREVHWVFVDGCHCRHCVTRDAKEYSRILLSSGEMVFHDASPKTQGIDSQDYPGMEGYHPVEQAAKGIAVREALDGINYLVAGRFPGDPRLALIQQAPADQERGGCEVYVKA